MNNTNNNENNLIGRQDYFKSNNNFNSYMNYNKGESNSDQQILNSFSWEDKVGKELYHGNDDPINDFVTENQYNNRSINRKIENGGIQTGYNLSAISNGQEPREIVAVHTEEGNLVAFKLDDGTILSKAEAIELTKAGGIKDCNVGRRGSREVLRKNPVIDASKTLTNLPRF